jgi:hypothetical protein
MFGTAGTASAAEVLAKTSFKGKNAFVVFTGTASIACEGGGTGVLDTTVLLSGFQQVSKSRDFPTSKANTVFAQVIQFNSCSGEFLTAVGAVDGAFRPRGAQATMDATIPLSNEAGTLDVDVQLTASGPLVKSRTRSRESFETPEGDVIVTFSHFMGKTREADATGTLIFNGIELQGSLTGAFLDDSKNGDMVVQH